MLGVTPHKRIFPSFFVYFFCVFFLIFKFSKERVYKVKRMVLGSIPNGGMSKIPNDDVFRRRQPP